MKLRDLKISHLLSFDRFTIDDDQIKYEFVNRSNLLNYILDIKAVLQYVNFVYLKDFFNFSYLLSDVMPWCRYRILSSKSKNDSDNQLKFFLDYRQIIYELTYIHRLNVAYENNLQLSSDNLSLIFTHQDKRDKLSIKQISQIKNYLDILKDKNFKKIDEKIKKEYIDKINFLINPFLENNFNHCTLVSDNIDINLAPFRLYLSKDGEASIYLGPFILLQNKNLFPFKYLCNSGVEIFFSLIHHLDYFPKINALISSKLFSKI
jgi:hypothetical protein